VVILRKAHTHKKRQESVTERERGRERARESDIATGGKKQRGIERKKDSLGLHAA
jgi:hypothetical protein